MSKKQVYPFYLLCDKATQEKIVTEVYTEKKRNFKLINQFHRGELDDCIDLILRRYDSDKKSEQALRLINLAYSPHGDSAINYTKLACILQHFGTAAQDQILDKLMAEKSLSLFRVSFSYLQILQGL